MTPQNVALSCDPNPRYLEFWEPVSRAWSRLGLQPHLFFVGPAGSEPPPYHGVVARIEPARDVPLHTQAQWARFHFTQTQPGSVWITSDLDMFPLSKKHFVDGVCGVPEDCWLAANSTGDYFPVCYNYATGGTFKAALSLPGDFGGSLAMLRWWEADYLPHFVDGVPKPHWFADEAFVSRKLVEFRRNFPSRVVQRQRPAPDGLSPRIDRADWRYDQRRLAAGEYFDCHSLRPYSRYRDEIEKILSLNPWQPVIEAVERTTPSSWLPDATGSGG